MWQVKQAKLLRDEIETLIGSLSDTRGLHDLVKEPLTKDSRGLATGNTTVRPWPLLPLIVCEAVCGCYKHALPAAATFQFLMAAGDVFDDIEDADSSDSLLARYGLAVATNVATTLLILAEKAIVRLHTRGVEDHIIVHVMDVVNSYYTTGCAGQHLDLSLNSEIGISEDTYLDVISMKSAAQIECACHIGALLATSNQGLIDTFAMLGHNLGMAAQITNDIQGVLRRSDIIKRKITLPVIYALAQAEGEVRYQLELAFDKQSQSSLTTTKIMDLLFHSGAIHYATVKMEFYRQRALDILVEIEKAGARVERLKLFL